MRARVHGVQCCAGPAWVPDQLLTDNGRVHGRLTRPHPAVVLFDRICQQQGIRHLLTKPAHPTTTGKIERFHRTLAWSCSTRRFTSVEAAQQASMPTSSTNNTSAAPGPGRATPAERFTYEEAARAVAPPVTDAELLALLPPLHGRAQQRPAAPATIPNAIRRASPASATSALPELNTTSAGGSQACRHGGPRQGSGSFLR